MTVLITDQIDPQCIEILRSGGFTVSYHPGSPRSEILKLIDGADALIVRSQTRVDAGVLEAGRRLKVVGRAGAGVDNIDVPTATRRGIIVMNTPGGNTISTAEHTISMMLALARNIPQADRSLRSGKWERAAFTGTELYGKTLGILGLGRVGAEVSRRAAAFGMVIIAYDPVQSAEAAGKAGARLVSMQELLKHSDIISVHTPLVPETKGIIGRDSLQLCRDGVRIINCARGGVVDEAALFEALQSGKVAGAALDVFEQEPPRLSPLIEHPHVVVTPHLGASTEEAQEKVAIQIARQVADALQGRGTPGSVNADIIGMGLKQEVRPYLLLAERLGRLLSQLKDGKLIRVTISGSGELLGEALPALSAAVLKGAFDRMLAEPVNYINAPVIAEERGIAVRQLRDAGRGHHGASLSVHYQTDREERGFAGTVFGEADLRIVAIDGFHFEIQPEGHLVLYYNIDRPGMLASVSSLLAKAGINIAGLSLGRFEPGKRALTAISIDSPAPGEVLKSISALEGVSEVKMVSF